MNFEVWLTPALLGGILLTTARAAWFVAQMRSEVTEIGKQNAAQSETANQLLRRVSEHDILLAKIDANQTSLRELYLLMRNDVDYRKRGEVPQGV